MKEILDLPSEIINTIIKYIGFIVFRNGKYLLRISNSDERYKILDKIEKPIYFSPNRFSLIFKTKSNKKGFITDHSYYENKHFFTICNYVKRKNGSIDHMYQRHYMFDNEGNCKESSFL
jgi:hypothetical protein